jgi:hypothetical protein
LKKGLTRSTKYSLTVAALRILNNGESNGL